jgi:hypothetical protein
MREPAESLENVDPVTLSELFSVGEEDRPRAWTAEVLREVLSHQLRAALVYDLGSVGALRDAEALGQQGVRTFADLMLHESPPLDLLRLAKDYFKSSLVSEHGPLPPDVARLLYYAVIGVAGLRHGQSISSLTKEELTRGLKWAASRDWADEPLRAVLDEALQWARGPI